MADSNRFIVTWNAAKRNNRYFAKRWYCYGTIIVLLLYPNIIYGEECTTQNYDSEEEPNFECMGPGEQLFNNPVNPPNSVPLEKGQSIIAPWDGAIVHRDRLINFGLKIIALRRLRWLDRLRFRELSTIESNYRNSLVENTAHFNEQLATVCNQNLMNSTAWYRSWWFGLTIGLVIGFGVTLGISYIFIAN